MEAAGATKTTELGTLNEVLEHCLPMVRRIAYKTAAMLGLPTGMDADDLVSHGVLGLADAYSRFDPDRGVAFEAYAALRVKGTIVDAIRAVDWVPRKVRAHARMLNETTAKLTSTLGRAPTPGEMSEALGGQKTRRRPPATLVALEEGRDSAGDSLSIVDVLASDGFDEPGARLEDAELRAELPEALAELEERDRLVLTLYYFEGVPMTQIAGLLGVTESRVSQLHMRALAGLRNRLEVA